MKQKYRGEKKKEWKENYVLFATGNAIIKVN